jgi:uncharacterized protein YjbI with pentapeptide repeats
MADQRALTLVQEDRHLDFNRLVEASPGPVDLSGGQFRAYDLRKYNLQLANLSNCYLRHADLRGLNLSEAQLEGASLKEAKVSGTLFPHNIAPEEIRLSLEQGTRLRTSRG